jgi:pimeloyl-ACP methyl ester carboxylesterase
MTYVPRRVPWSEDVQVRGLRHRLTWWGERTNNPIVLLHGFLDCGATWQFLVDRLPASWTLVAPDWRGFGASEWIADGACYWFPDYFADLDVLLDLLVPQSRARVIGHSMGANVASVYAGIRPQRLEWLVNLEGLGLSSVRAEEAPKRYARWIDEVRDPFKEGRYDSLEQLTSVLRMKNGRLTQERAEFIAKAWSQPEGEKGEVRLCFDPRHRYVNPVLYRREETLACWSRAEVPILLVMGELSEHRTKHAGQTSDAYWHSMFKRLRIANIPGTGHMMHHEDPEHVAQQIVAFERDYATLK